MGCCGSKEKSLQLENIDSEKETNTIQQTPPQSPAADVKVFIALYDYDARTDEDLSFKKGDYLEVKDEDCKFDWWMATSRTSGKNGFIPNNYVAEVKTLEAEE